MPNRLNSSMPAEQRKMGSDAKLKTHFTLHCSLQAFLSNLFARNLSHQWSKTAELGVFYFKDMFAFTYDGFVELVPGCSVIAQPMSRPFSTGGVGGPGHYYASFTRDIQQGTAQGRTYFYSTLHTHWIKKIMSNINQKLKIQHKYHKCSKIIIKACTAWNKAYIAKTNT